MNATNLKCFRTFRVFWHQLLRKQLSGPADIITYRILRFTKGTLFTRYIHLFLVFLLSGLLHQWVEVGQGMAWQQSGQLHFFMTQVMGILLEDTIQGVYRSCRGIERSQETTAARRLTGYVWVLVFLWWSTPAWFYPRLRLSEGDNRDQLLPFSVFKMLRT